MESIGETIWIGLVAGFIATVILSGMMLMKNTMGLMPQFDMISMMAGLMNTSHAMAWVVHFIVGTVLYGGVFGWWAPLVGGDAYWLKGLVWGAVGWFIASTVMLPMAGNGPFGIKLGAMMPVMSLMMHAVFGLILGAIFGWMMPA